MVFTKRLVDIVQWTSQGVDSLNREVDFHKHLNWNFIDIPKDMLSFLYYELDTERDILENYWASKENSYIKERRIFQYDLRLVKKVLEEINFLIKK